MADDRHYVPGDFYRICERTGYKVRAKRTRKEWTGRIVRDRSFELRQPQDFVRGTLDRQIVPEPRPRQPDVFIEVTVPSYAAQGSPPIGGGGQGAPPFSAFNDDFFSPDFGPDR